jgi:hypothetical protein
MSVMNSRRFTAEYLPCPDRKDSTPGRKSAALRPTSAPSRPRSFPPAPVGAPQRGGSDRFGGP